MKRDKAFTMVEMIVVMGIIAVLAAFAVPAVGKHIETSRQMADLESVHAAYDDLMVAYMMGDDAAVSAGKTIRLTHRDSDWGYIDSEYKKGSSELVPFVLSSDLQKLTRDDGSKGVITVTFDFTNTTPVANTTTTPGSESAGSGNNGFVPKTENEGEEIDDPDGAA